MNSLPSIYKSPRIDRKKIPIWTQKTKKEKYKSDLSQNNLDKWNVPWDIYKFKSIYRWFQTHQIENCLTTSSLTKVRDNVRFRLLEQHNQQKKHFIKIRNPLTKKEKDMLRLRLVEFTQYFSEQIKNDHNLNLMIQHIESKIN